MTFWEDAQFSVQKRFFEAGKGLFFGKEVDNEKKVCYTITVEMQ